MARALPETPHDRARRLLRQVLTPEEQALYVRNRSIIITGSEGGKYEVGVNSYSGNIRPLQPVWTGKGVHRRRATPSNLLCAHPRMHRYTDDGYWLGDLPSLDAVVTQILTIKANEKHFLRTAYVYI